MGHFKLTQSKHLDFLFWSLLKKRLVCLDKTALINYNPMWLTGLSSKHQLSNLDKTSLEKDGFLNTKLSPQVLARSEHP